jgi:hypothetical protein
MRQCGSLISLLLLLKSFCLQPLHVVLLMLSHPSLLAYQHASSFLISGPALVTNLVESEVLA